ncbi:glycosyltransferase [Pseudomonas tohonis]|nr:hypothetical protein L682_10085 [Pseudomonas alcaligenes OT 69]MDN4144555.1 glycosyltransferase [Pseudomonas tohonis]
MADNDIRFERDLAIRERDTALRHLAELRNSSSWRITRPLRAFIHLLRFGSTHIAEPDLQSHFTSALPSHPAASGSASAPVDAEGRLDILCFANIDWTARFQRPQQLMSQFARAGYRVFYIVPSRKPPSGQPYDCTEVAPGVWEVALQCAKIGDCYSRAIAAQTQADYEQAIAALVNEMRIRTAASVVHLSYWTPLVLKLRDEYGWKIQYDCMDDWEDFPAIGAPLLDQERALVAQADLLSVTASVLQEKWQGENDNCLLLRNGVDFEFFERHCVPNDLLESLERPVIGFYGAIAEWLDLPLLAQIADARPDWNFVLIGDIFVDDLAGLDSKHNVHLLGRKPYGQMPLYLYRFDVCLIPFRLYNVTHAVDPVKFYEFISAGKPVVSVPLDEMRHYERFVYFADDAASFIEKIQLALDETDLRHPQERVALARENDWRQRFEANQAALVGLYPKLSIVVVTYNNVALTRGCIDSLIRDTTYPNYELIIIDNASSDDSRNYLRFLARTRKNVRIQLNDHNLGFAAANNQGLEMADGQFLLLLNNDTVVPKGWVDPLLRHLEDPAIGLVGPLTNAVGNEAKIEVDYTDLQQMEVFAERRTRPHRGQCFDIPMLAMFCVAMRRDTFEKIGPLDEAFGIGMFEDDDYSRRIQAAGLRTVCAEDAFIHHYGQASFKKLIASGEYQALWDRNQAYFESKWGAWKRHQPRALQKDHQGDAPC